MPVTKGIFGEWSAFDDRSFRDLQLLRSKVEHCRGLDYKIVLTSGSFDLIHIGHAEYLEKAKKFGDVLVVGVDSDEKVRRRKGADRPIVPEEERMRMISHIRAADMIYLKALDDLEWALIEAVKPDILVITEGAYDQSKIEELEARFGCKVEVLEPQATTSTSARLGELYKTLADTLTESLIENLPGTIRNIIQASLPGP